MNKRRLSLWASATPAEQEDSKWVATYGAFAGAILAISLARSLGFFAAALRGASSLHAAAAARLLSAPLAFFHATPAGRILNRFSRDQGALDEQLPTVAWDALQAGMSVLGALVLLAVVVPAILPVFIPLVVAFLWVQRRYLVASRECKRLEAVTRSPLYASFSEALRGLPTIRAYAAGPRLRAAFLAAASRNAGWSFCWLTTARWVGFRLDLMVSLVLTAAPLLVMALRGRISPRLAALALTQSLQLAGVAQWCVRQAAEVENNMTSAERVLEYASELEQEADPGGAPPAGWPADGAVAFENVGALYRLGLPRVLRGLTFSVPGGSGCGVVGRTGSGKSSLLLALLRLIPVVEGRVLVGGADAAALPLRALRRQVAVIPQDPVLFSGTLRSNLDPWGEHADARLWDALRAAQLDAAARGAGGLGARVAEGGDSLSAGQRQLLCLARALLADAAVLALDEATANVDAATDAAVGRAVAAARRSSLDGAGGGARRRTLLVIAHRVDTIMGLDQLIVLADGALVEAGPPRELAARAGGAFAAMAGAARGRAGSLDR
jgi:ABC-type multidrug transport system fused ATPase/permease subunit